MSTTAAAPDAPGKVGAKTNKPVAQTRTGPVTHSHKVIPGSFEMENHYCKRYFRMISYCYEFD